jgi:hypothetical protein
MGSAYREPQRGGLAGDSKLEMGREQIMNDENTIEKELK